MLFSSLKEFLPHRPTPDPEQSRMEMTVLQISQWVEADDAHKALFSLNLQTHD